MNLRPLGMRRPACVLGVSRVPARLADLLVVLVVIVGVSLRLPRPTWKRPGFMNASLRSCLGPSQSGTIRSIKSEHALSRA